MYSNLPDEITNRLASTEELSPNMIMSSHSFKLASEVALMIVFLFQCYPRLLQENAEKLLPLMVKVGMSAVKMMILARLV